MDKHILLTTCLLLSPWVAAVDVDPTRPLDSTAQRSAATPNALTLNSILLSEQRRVAVINGVTAQVGDRIANAKVVAIHADRVVIEIGGQRRELTLNKPKIKRAVKRSGK